jgi:hypothetical protein
MIYKSAASILSDTYRAGNEIGEVLKEISPEVILLFASITLENNYADFIAGLRDGLETVDILVFGGTGDGIYETSVTAHYGVCALGIASGGKVTWSTAVETGVGLDSSGTARLCAASALEKLSGTAEWGFVLADGITADGTGIVEGIRELITFPFIGGLTGDDRKFTRSRIFVNDQVVNDGIAILLASGGIPFVTHSASGFVPVGVPGMVEETEGKSIKRISGLTPLTFIMEQIGKPLAEADLGILALANDTDLSRDTFFLRVMLNFDKPTGAITCFGSIPEGATVRVSGADREQLLQAVSSGIERIMRSGFSPTAAIVISCVGRKWQLNNCGQEEVKAIQNVIGKHIPLIGFPSFGEIGPFLKNDSTYSETYFHNATCVICLLGA